MDGSRDGEEAAEGMGSNACGHPSAPSLPTTLFCPLLLNLGAAVAVMGMETPPEKNNPALNFQFVDYFSACEGSTQTFLPCSIPLALKWGEGLGREST